MNVCGLNTGSAGSIRFSFAAKNSSEAATTEPPSSRAARSGSSPSSTAAPFGPVKERSPRGGRVDRNAPQPRAVDDPGELGTGVGRQRVPVGQPGRVDGERLVGGEGDQVGVVAHGD